MVDRPRRSDVTQEEADRFWARVNKSGPLPARPELGPCWVWTGAKMPTGHGNLCIRTVWWLAHRLAYVLAVGPVPAGYLVHHRCEYPSCVNPAHLQALTRKQHSAEHGLSGAAAAHAAKTTCSEGHPLELEKSGRRRSCPICVRRYKREWARQKARGMAA